MTDFSAPKVGKPTAKYRKNDLKRTELYPWATLTPGTYVECKLSEKDLAQYLKNYLPKFIGQGRSYFLQKHPELKFSAHRIEHDVVAMWVELREPKKVMDLDTRRAILQRGQQK